MNTSRTGCALPWRGGGQVASFSEVFFIGKHFFVLLYAMSDVDKAKFETLTLTIRQALTGQHTTEVAVEGGKPKDLTESLRDSLSAELSEGMARVRTTPKGIEIEFNNSTLFRVGSAAIRNGIKPKMGEVAAYLKNLPERFKIEVEGHTDDVPIKTPRYPDNWELSAARATAVVRYFQDSGVAGARMKAIGLADTRPKRPNKTPAGLGLPLNRAQNRRVTVQILQY